MIHFGITKGSDYLLSTASYGVGMDSYNTKPYLPHRLVTSHLFETKQVTFQTWGLLAKMTKMAKFIKELYSQTGQQTYQIKHYLVCFDINYRLILMVDEGWSLLSCY